MPGTNFYGELVRAQLQNSASDLTPTATGLVYFNTTTGVKWYTGSAWLTAADLTTSQVFTNKDYDGGTASNTSRITLPKASSSTLNALTRKEATLVYDTTTSQVKYDNGTSLLAVGSSSGAGEINAVLNPSVADTTTGWTNGTSHTLTRVTSGSPLDPVITTALSIAATTTATESATSGEYYSIASLASGLRNKKLKIEFYFTTEASQTWAISVWQGATRKSLSTDSSGATTLPAGTTGKFTAYLDTDSSAAYTVNFTRTAGSGTATLLVTSVIFGPGIQPQGAVITEWETWTPTFYNLGTVTNINFKRRRVGSMMESIGYFTTGTVSAAIGSIGMPTGLNVDTSKLAGNRSTQLGNITRLTTATIDPLGKVYLTYSSTGGTDRLLIAESTTGGAYEQKNVDNILAGTENEDVYMLVPIAEWAGSGTVNLAQNDVEYAYNSSTTDADDTTSFGYGPGGTGFGSYTAARQKTVRFQTPHQENDSYQIEIFDTTAWIPLGTYSNSVLPLTNQGTETYGMTLDNSSTSGTDLVVQFGKYRLVGSGTFGAAGLAWSGLSASFKWRVKKVKGGVAVGFGIVSESSSGLMPSTNTNLDNAAATRLGLKQYSHGTTYNGGNAPTITLTAGGGTLSSVDLSLFIPYQMQDGTWRMKFNVVVSLSLISRTTVELTVAGVTFKNVATSGVGQSISADCATAATLGLSRAKNNSGVMDTQFSSVSCGAARFSGDVQLESKPTWAY